MHKILNNYWLDVKTNKWTNETKIMPSSSFPGSSPVIQAAPGGNGVPRGRAPAWADCHQHFVTVTDDLGCPVKFPSRELPGVTGGNAVPAPPTPTLDGNRAAEQRDMSPPTELLCTSSGAGRPLFSTSTPCLAE